MEEAYMRIFANLILVAVIVYGWVFAFPVSAHEFMMAIIATILAGVLGYLIWNTWG
jgi:hypothetical protein